jgi:photosystem II stability/assembly factor-like uncharacterized protein
MHIRREQSRPVVQLIWMLISIFLLSSCTVAPETAVPIQVESVTPTIAPTSTPTRLPGPWQIVGVYTADQSIMTAGFYDETHVATGGVIGIMGYSDDAGKNWLVTDAKSDCRYGMDIISPQVIWACGGATNVRKSLDAGQTWQAVTGFGEARTITNPCHSASFIDENTGWLANSNIFGTTTDGGEIWNMKALPETANKIATIDTYAPNEGYLLDQKGALFFTQDDGEHWRQAGQLELGTIELPATAYQLAAMRFSDSLHGMIVISSSPYATQEPVMAFHTSDGGQTWTSEMVPVLAGPIYLAREGNLLTVISGVNQLTLLRYEG